MRTEHVSPWVRCALKWAFIALPCFLWTSPGHTQSATRGAIQGVVTDAHSKQPLAGVTVTVTSDASKAQQSTFTSEAGTYKITDLTPGRYLVVFYFGGRSLLELSNVHVSASRTTPAFAKLDLTKVGTVYESSGELFIDPTSTIRGETFKRDQLELIPLPGRDQEAAAGSTAGASGDASGIAFSGSTGAESLHQIDGVSTGNLSYGTIGTRLINDFTDEVQVITGGYNAEYGRSTGGIVSVVTKSGTNELHGSVFSHVTPGFLVAARDRTPTESSSIDVDRNVAWSGDLGFDLGGPVVKDKVWFYVGAAPRFQRVDIDKITKRLTDCRSIQADGTLSECDPGSHGDGVPDEDPNTGFRIFETLDTARFTEDQRSMQMIGKLNFAAAAEHQGQLSIIATPGAGRSIGVRGAPSATRLDFRQLTTDVAAKWLSKFNDNKTELSTVLGWHRSTLTVGSIDDRANDTPRQNLYFGSLGTWSALGFESDKTRVGCLDSASAGDPYPFIANCPDDGAGYAMGGPGGLVDDKEQRASLRLGVTHRVKAAGSHEIKLGIDAEQNRTVNTRHISGGVYYDNYLAPFNRVVATRWVRLAPPDDATGFDDTCRHESANTADDRACTFIDRDEVTGTTLNWAAYLRDSWQIRPNVTFNAGLRYEEQRLRYAESLQNSTDPFTGAELGKNAMTLRNMWAPRVGLLYDWTKEGRSKAFAHWGRFYESIPMDINNRSFGGETMYRQTFDSTSQCGDAEDGIGGPPARNCMGTPALGSELFGSGVLVAPGIKAQFMDELLLGVEYEVMEDLKVGVTLQSRSLGRILEDLSVDNADTYILANPGEWSADEEAKLEGEIAMLPAGDERDRLQAMLDQFRRIRGFDKPRRDYTALQLTATKRFSRKLFVQGSYTYSTTRGNYPGLFSSDNGQLDPNISSQFDLIELLANRDGPLPLDRPHYVKLDGYYLRDIGRLGILTSGMRFRALSGTPQNALGRHYLYGDNESFLLPRGAMGRTDFELGIDLHVGYRRKLRRGMSLDLFADIFGLFNRQGVARTSETYTRDPVNPIVGGDYTDLVFAKRQSDAGEETAQPARRWRNFGNPTARYAPLSARLGARLTF